MYIKIGPCLFVGVGGVPMQRWSGSQPQRRRRALSKEPGELRSSPSSLTVTFQPYDLVTSPLSHFQFVDPKNECSEYRIPGGLSSLMASRIKLV